MLSWWKGLTLGATWWIALQPAGTWEPTETGRCSSKAEGNRKHQCKTEGKGEAGLPQEGGLWLFQTAVCAGLATVLSLLPFLLLSFYQDSKNQTKTQTEITLSKALLCPPLYQSLNHLWQWVSAAELELMVLVSAREERQPLHAVPSETCFNFSRVPQLECIRAYPVVMRAEQ